MHLARILTAVLAIQSQAASAGADLGQYSERAQLALYAQLSKIPFGIVPETEPEEAPKSCYDPDSYDEIMVASRCRALLLEVIRRAAHDWVLYRNTRRPERAFARSAYVWLFEEEPGHPDWETRKREGEPLMAFLTICECLDLDPDVVRRRVKQMTIRDIMAAGRPAETRKVKHEGVEDYSTPSSIEIELISLEDVAGSSYENQFALQA